MFDSAICPNCGGNDYPSCCGQEESPADYPRSMVATAALQVALS
jgi:hypothetical protein